VNRYPYSYNRFPTWGQMLNEEPEPSGDDEELPTVRQETEDDE
jgi:hypothetical protein